MNFKKLEITDPIRGKVEASFVYAEPDELAHMVANKPFEKTHLYYTIKKQIPFLSPNGPWLAGGAIRRFIQSSDRKYEGGDLDISCASTDQYFHCKKLFDRELRGRGMEHGRSLQLIKFDPRPSPEETIWRFNYTINQGLYDGTKFILAPRTLWDIGREELVVAEGISNPFSAFMRHSKYTSLGYTFGRGEYKRLQQLSDKSVAEGWEHEVWQS